MNASTELRILPAQTAALPGVDEPARPVEAGRFFPARRLLSSLSIYAATNFGVRGLNFLLLPIITRLLRPADYGLIALADTVAAPIGMLCGVGAASSLRRMYFEYLDDPLRRRAYVGTAVRFVMLTCVAGVLVTYWLGPHIIRGLDEGFAAPFFPFIALAIAGAAFGQILQTHLSLLQVQQRPGQFAVLSMLAFGVGTLLTLWFLIGYRAGAVGVLTGRLLSLLIVIAIATYWTRGFWTASWDGHGLREHLRLGVPFALYEVMSVGLIFADRLILQHYRSLEEVGIYSIAYTFGSAMLILTGSLSQAWSPLFFESAGRGKWIELKQMSSVIMIGLTTIAILGVVAAQPGIRFLLDQRYAKAAPLVPVILGAYLFNSFYYLFEVAAVQKKRTRTIVAVTVAALGINIGLNLLCVPRWGVWGAAWATLAAYALQALLMFLALGTQVKNLYSYSSITKSLGIFILALASVQGHAPLPIRIIALSAALAAGTAVLWRADALQILRNLRDRA